MPMMSESTYTTGPSTQSSFTEPSHTEIPLPQVSLGPNHAHWIDLIAQIFVVYLIKTKFIV